MPVLGRTNRKNAKMDEKELKDQLNLLKRGLLQNDNLLGYKTYNKLYKVGHPVIPHLKELVFQSDWSDQKYPMLTRYVSGLINLIFDIDEAIAKEVAQKVISNGCNIGLKLTLNSLIDFSISNYKIFNIKGIRIFLSNKVRSKDRIDLLLQDWLSSIPSKHLEDIVRIYVVSKKELKKGVAGNYMPYLCTISICWRKLSFLNRFISKKLGKYTPYRLWEQMVLFHEIGHHIKHHPFGSDPEQEKEADEFAYKIIKNRYPENVYSIDANFRRYFKYPTKG